MAWWRYIGGAVRIEMIRTEHLPNWNRTLVAPSQQSPVYLGAERDSLFIEESGPIEDYLMRVHSTAADYTTRSHHPHRSLHG